MPKIRILITLGAHLLALAFGTRNGHGRGSLDPILQEQRPGYHIGRRAM